MRRPTPLPFCSAISPSGSASPDRQAVKEGWDGVWAVMDAQPSPAEQEVGGISAQAQADRIVAQARASGFAAAWGLDNA